jgi:heavy metal efflux system protein
VALFALSLFILFRMGGEFLPTLEEGDFAVDTRVLTGSSLKTTMEHTGKAASILLKEFPEVEKVVTKIGSGEVPTDPMPMEAADMMVILKPKKEWTSAKTFPELAERMSSSLEKLPGITTGFQYPVQMRFNELMTGARQDVVCKIFGDDLDTLTRYVEQLAGMIRTVDGAEDLYIEKVAGVDQVVVSLDRSALSRYGLDVDEVNNIVNASFAGKKAGTVYEGDRGFDLVVRMSGDLRNNLREVENLLVPVPSGEPLPLRLLARIEVSSGPYQVNRENARRRIVAGFNVRGRDVESIVEELKEKVNDGLRLPPGYTIEYGGAFKNLEEASARLAVAVPVALALIFVFLYLAFGNGRQALLVYSAIPLSATGGILLLAARGMPFSISAGIGFIALFGVAVLNGIVLISEFNRLRAAGMTNICRVVITGTHHRLRPVLITALVASLGFLPMAISTGAGAEVQRPLATVVIGGLVLATFLTLLILPVLYAMTERRLKLKSGLTAPLLFAFLLLSPASQSQPVTVSLQQAIDSAMKNNLGVKHSRLAAEYRRLLVRSASDLPPLIISAEAGQINSAYIDTKFGISQQFSMPAYYSRQKSHLTEEWKSATASTSLTMAQLKKAVTDAFFTALLLSRKEETMLRADSIFTAQLDRATRRFNAGEANVLEQAAAETQVANIRAELEYIRSQLGTARLELRLLMNTASDPEPRSVSLTAPLPMLSDTSSIAHPVLKVLESDRAAAEAAVRMEKARLVPAFTLGYSNQSLQGVGADDKVYPVSARFSAVQIGIGVPLFSGAQRARIRASRAQAEISGNEYALRALQLKSELSGELAKFRSHQAIVQQFEKRQLPAAQKILEVAGQQLAAGEINYLEWAMLNQQAFQTRLNYFDALLKLSQSAAMIDYLMEK